MSRSGGGIRDPDTAAAFDRVGSVVVGHRDASERGDDEERQSSAAAFVMPLHDSGCTQQLTEKYEQALRETELTRNNLSVLAVLASANTIVFSIFTQLLYSNMNNSLVTAEVQWLLLLLAVFTLLLFKVIELLLRTPVMFRVLMHSETWFRVLLAIYQTLRMVAVFLVVTFAVSLLAQQWLASHFNALETLFGIVDILLAVQLTLVVAKK